MYAKDNKYKDLCVGDQMFWPYGDKPHKYAIHIQMKTNYEPVYGDFTVSFGTRLAESLTHQSVFAPFRLYIANAPGKSTSSIVMLIVE